MGIKQGLECDKGLMVLPFWLLLLRCVGFISSLSLPYFCVFRLRKVENLPLSSPRTGIPSTLWPMGSNHFLQEGGPA